MKRITMVTSFCLENKEHLSKKLIIRPRPKKMRTVRERNKTEEVPYSFRKSMCEYPEEEEN